MPAPVHAHALLADDLDQRILTSLRLELEHHRRENRRCLVVYDLWSVPGRMLASVDDRDQVAHWKAPEPILGVVPPDPGTDDFARSVAQAWSRYDVHELIPVIEIHPGQPPLTALRLCTLPWVPAPHAHCPLCGARMAQAGSEHECVEPE